VCGLGHEEKKRAKRKSSVKKKRLLEATMPQLNTEKKVETRGTGTPSKMAVKELFLGEKAQSRAKVSIQHT